MSPPPDADALTRFRAALYATGLGRRKDSLFETLDAVLTAAGPETLARLSLAPGFRRGWASVADALAEGQVDLPAVRRLLLRTLPPVPSEDLQRPLWVGDASTWPRPEAKTSPERTSCRRVSAGVPQEGIVPGWEYHWLVAVPEAEGSWILPLDVVRRRPSPDRATPTALVLGQVRAAGWSNVPQRRARPVVALDSGNDPVALARAQQDPAGLAADCLVRLAAHRVLPNGTAGAYYGGRSAGTRSKRWLGKQTTACS